MNKTISVILLALCLMMTLMSAGALAADSNSGFSASSYTGGYDGEYHSITLNFTPGDFAVLYSKDGKTSWVEDKPAFKDVGTYIVDVGILKGSDEIEPVCSATVTITKGTPELYFTPGNIVFQPGEKSRQLKWVYNGDGRLYFTSSDSRHFWVDPSGGLVSLNQEGGVSIWATAEETKNCKSVTAMCIVETESTLPQIDIDTKLEYTGSASDLLQTEAGKISSGKDSFILYLDAKLLDPRDPLQKKELHNVRASFNVPYKEIFKESIPDPDDVKLSVSDIATSFDYTVLHQQINGTIENVPFIPRVDGLQIGDTTLSPFAIIAYPKENYNLYYDVNGGTGTPLNQSVPMDSKSYSDRVSPVRPTREGATFMGWSLSRGGDVQYKPGDAITLDKDIVLFAVWDAVSTADLPQTGDNSRTGLWLTLMLAALLALACIPLLRRKDA